MGNFFTPNSPLLPMIPNVLILFVLTSLLVLLSCKFVSAGGPATPFTCNGDRSRPGPTAPSITTCQPPAAGSVVPECVSNQRTVQNFVLARPPNIGAANLELLKDGFGCEDPEPGQPAGSPSHCCQQYCEDGLTPVYYKDVFEIDRATGRKSTTPHLRATARCPQTAAVGDPCPTNSSEVCYDANSDDGLFFCCPRLNVITLAPPIFPGGSGGCLDLGGNDCLLKEFLCNNTLYFDLMTWQCPQTCNRCPPDGSQPTRPPGIVNPPLPNRDCKELLDCPLWRRNGFCQNGFYSNDTKAQMCPLSCQLGCAIQQNF